MEHDRQMALKAEAEKIASRKKLSEVQRGALHVQMQERENFKLEVRRRSNDQKVHSISQQRKNGRDPVLAQEKSRKKQ